MVVGDVSAGWDGSGGEFVLESEQHGSFESIRLSMGTIAKRLCSRSVATANCHVVRLFEFHLFGVRTGSLMGTIAVRGIFGPATHADVMVAGGQVDDERSFHYVAPVALGRGIPGTLPVPLIVEKH